MDTERLHTNLSPHLQDDPVSTEHLNTQVRLNMDPKHRTVLLRHAGTKYMSLTRAIADNVLQYSMDHSPCRPLRPSEDTVRGPKTDTGPDYQPVLRILKMCTLVHAPAVRHNIRTSKQLPSQKPGMQSCWDFIERS